MNKTVLMGRLTRDPEIRYSTGENPIAIARYTLAVDRKRQVEGQPSADFIPCKALGKLGEVAEKYYKKGTKIAVSGRLETGSYTNKDGQKIYTMELMIEEQEFAESKSSGSSAPTEANTDGFMNVPDGIDEELPFA